MLLATASCLLAALTLPGSLYLAVLTLAGSSYRRPTRALPLPGRIAIVVPAHDEAPVIARTLRNLCAAARSDGASDVVVVADNCSDDTSAIARDLGARVLERHDASRRGKGHALDHAFAILLREDYAAFAVVDADTLADDNFLVALRRTLGAGALAAQTRYTVLNGGDAPRTRLAEIALAAFNVLRPRGRERLGLSVGILGNGFALRREVLEAVPYTARSVVEDLEYHLRLVGAGIRVAFVDDTTVRGEMPTGEQGSRSQRARWEGGRLRMLRDHGPTLARAALRGRLRFIEPLADLLLLPLAYHTTALLAAMLAALLARALSDGALSAAALAVAAVGLAVLGLHVLASMRVASLPWSRLLELTQVPGYLFWKLRMVSTTLAGASERSRWVRTDRTGS